MNLPRHLNARLGWLALACAFTAATVAQAQNDDALAWPALTSQTKPWCFWWWPGSAVDTTNLTRNLDRYSAAGLGGVHIIPIYGAKGAESSYVNYLSPEWMRMMGYTVTEAGRLGMGVDMTTGTGWCFGGPNVSDQDANASVVVKTYDVAAGHSLTAKIDPVKTQALLAFLPDGSRMDLSDKIRADGSVNWTANGHDCRVYAVSQKPSGQKVKRPAPGGEGWMLNLISPDAVTHWLQRFTDAFAAYAGPKPRAQFQDSYEYRSNWSPDFLAQFEKLRGYPLQAELPALFGGATNADTDRVRGITAKPFRTSWPMKPCRAGWSGRISTGSSPATRPTTSTGQTGDAPTRPAPAAATTTEDLIITSCCCSTSRCGVQSAGRPR